MISRAGASALRVFELLDAPLEVTDAPGATAVAAASSGASSSRTSSFRYAGSEREILRGVSFVVEPGQMVALLGTTGAGKSTIINLIPRFYDVTGGSVLVDGHDVRAGDALVACARRSASSCRRRCSSPGRCATTSPTAGPTPPIDEVRAAAEAAQAHEFIAALAATATTPSSASAASGCRADSGSASPSRACF